MSVRLIKFEILFKTTTMKIRKKIFIAYKMFNGYYHTHTHKYTQNSYTNENYVRVSLKLHEFFFNFVIVINCVRD
jgi:hypothetical protein